MRKLLPVLLCILLSQCLSAGNLISSENGKLSRTLDTAFGKRQGGFFSSLNFFYKKYISDQISASCEFDPSCSVFSKQAFQTFGPLKGICLSTDRLMRCNGRASGETPSFYTHPGNARIIDKVDFYRFKPDNQAWSNSSTCQISKSKVWVSGLLSAIIPGSGKFYLGAPYQGTTSFITNLIYGGAAAEILVKTGNRYLSTASLGVFSVYYAGNIFGTVALAKKQQQDPCRESSIRAENKHYLESLKKPYANRTREINTESTLRALANKEYSTAYNMFVQLPDSVIRKDKSLQKGWMVTLVENNRFEQCREILLNQTDTALSLYKELKLLPTSIQFKSSGRAGLLSSFIPGAGQIYAGKPGKGVISLILQSAFIAVAVIAFKEELFIAGTVYGILPFLKFYKGGKLNARSLALKHNEQKMEELKGKYLVYIQQLILQENH